MTLNRLMGRLMALNRLHRLVRASIFACGNQYNLVRNLRKRTFWYMRQTKTKISLRIRAVWSVFVCSLEITLHPWVFKMRTVKILIRLRECAGWSESSLSARPESTFSWRYGSSRTRLFRVRTSFPYLINRNQQYKNKFCQSFSLHLIACKILNNFCDTLKVL